MSKDIDSYDYQRYAILFVDDEATTRKYFRRLFGEKFRILEAEDGVEALAVFKQHADEIGVIVTDQRMPNETGVGFLSKIADKYPDIIKILSTAYSDIDAAIGSVNQGGIFRYMTKPWDIPQLEVTLRRAMEFFTVKRERDALLGAKMQAMGNVLLSSRLASFALAPVCAGISLKRGAEAIASFLQTGVAGRRTGDDEESAFRSPDWARLHSRQIELATAPWRSNFPKLSPFPACRNALPPWAHNSPPPAPKTSSSAHQSWRPACRRNPTRPRSRWMHFSAGPTTAMSSHPRSGFWQPTWRSMMRAAPSAASAAKASRSTSRKPPPSHQPGLRARKPPSG
ncbi:MAG: response regulator [Akkermansiaceae bacterium]|nr:response regulator [Akkermansiaceae bacterium]